MQIHIGHLLCEYSNTFVPTITLPNGDTVCIPHAERTGDPSPHMIASAVRIYLQGLFLAAERLTNQGEKSAQEQFAIRTDIHAMWQKANTL